jgi:hypothetical protein
MSSRFRTQLEANLFGVVNVTRAALPVLRAQRSGHIIQFSSIGGRVGGTPGMGAYQTAKFGVEGFSEVLNAEVNPLGIKVIIVEPGPFRTEWSTTSMVRAQVGPDYEQTVGEINRMREVTAATWPGDPARAAKIILDVVALDEPPLRLLLGGIAVDSAVRSAAERTAEAEKWGDLSRSADFPPGVTGLRLRGSGRPRTRSAIWLRTISRCRRRWSAGHQVAPGGLVGVADDGGGAGQAAGQVGHPLIVLGGEQLARFSGRTPRR